MCEHTFNLITWVHYDMNFEERVIWNSFTLNTWLIDSWHVNNFSLISNKAYTFDNGRQRLGSSLSKLDHLKNQIDWNSGEGNSQLFPHSKIYRTTS